MSEFEVDRPAEDDDVGGEGEEESELRLGGWPKWATWENAVDLYALTWVSYGCAYALVIREWWWAVMMAWGLMGWVFQVMWRDTARRWRFVSDGWKAQSYTWERLYKGTAEGRQTGSSRVSLDN